MHQNFLASPCRTPFLNVPLSNDPSVKVMMPSPSSFPSSNLPDAFWMPKLVEQSDSEPNVTSPKPLIKIDVLNE